MKRFLKGVLCAGISVGFIFCGFRVFGDCPSGCYDGIHSYCMDATTYVSYGLGVALDDFNDPSADPDKVADVNDIRSKRVYHDCASCTCTYNACTYPCVGVFQGGTVSDYEQVTIETECSDAI